MLCEREDDSGSLSKDTFHSLVLLTKCFAIRTIKIMQDYYISTSSSKSASVYKLPSLNSEWLT